MTRRVRMRVPCTVRVNETELAILRVLEGSPSGSISLSIGEFSTRLGRCDASVRRSIGLLEQKGLIEVHSRYLRNGGQVENEYELTEVAQEYLQLVAPGE